MHDSTEGLPVGHEETEVTEETPEGLFRMTVAEQQQVLLGNRLTLFHCPGIRAHAATKPICHD